jgi:hypothetical protein
LNLELAYSLQPPGLSCIFLAWNRHTLFLRETGMKFFFPLLLLAALAAGAERCVLLEEFTWDG